MLYRAYRLLGSMVGTSVVDGLVDVMSVDVMSVDVMSVDVMSVDVMSVDGMAVDGMAVDGMAVDGMAVDGMAVDGMSVVVPGCATPRYRRVKKTSNFDNMMEGEDSKEKI